MALLVTARQRQGAILAVTWVCFTTMVLLVVHYHEPWFDEAQAWLLARDSTLFELLCRRMRYEGSPALWHVMLWALARVGAPFRTMSYLSGLLASMSAFLVLYFAPFPIWMRGLFVFGYYPAYQYAVVARSYGLNLLLIVLTAILYPARASKPFRYCLILAALANTNAFGFLVAGVLFADFAISAWWSLSVFTKPFVISEIIFVIAALLAALQAAPAWDVSFPHYHPLTPTGVFSKVIVQMVSGFVEFGPPTPNRLMIGFLLSLCVLAVGLALAARATKLMLVVSMLGAPLAFQVLKYASPWHAGLIYLSWVFGVWISWPALNTLSIRLRQAVVITTALLFVVQAYDGLAAWRLDLRAPYSPAPQAAMFLHGYFAANPSRKLACVGDWAFAVQPYFSQNICANYYAGAPKPSYVDWKSGQPLPDRPDAQYSENLMRAAQFDALLVCGYALHRPESEAVARSAGYCLVRSFESKMIWKDHFSHADDLIVFEKCAESLPGAP